MNIIKTIAIKEFKEYFYSPIAYVFIIVLLSVISWFFFADLFVAGQASMRSFFNLMPIFFLIFLPAVTMGKWSEEKKLGTLEILLTLPVKDLEVTLGKFVASFFFLLVTLCFTLPLVLTVSLLGDLDGGTVIAGYLGLTLLGAACLAIGLFISSLNESAIVSFIVAFLILLLLYLIGTPVFYSRFPDFIAPFFSSLSLSFHFQSISRGVIDSRDILYYLSITGFFVYLNVLSLEGRRS